MSSHPRHMSAEHNTKCITASLSLLANKLFPLAKLPVWFHSWANTKITRATVIELCLFTGEHTQTCTKKLHEQRSSHHPSHAMMMMDDSGKTSGNQLESIHQKGSHLHFLHTGCYPESHKCNWKKPFTHEQDRKWSNFGQFFVNDFSMTQNLLLSTDTKTMHTKFAVKQCIHVKHPRVM